MVNYLYKKNKHTIKNRNKNSKTKKNVYKSLKLFKTNKNIMLGGSNKNPPLINENKTLKFIEDVIEFKKKIQNPKYTVKNGVYTLKEQPKTPTSKLLLELMEKLFTSVDNYKLFVDNNEKIGKESYKNICDSNTNILIIDMHGVTIPSLFKLPDNVNIVFLSPISYITCTNLSYINDNILKQIKEHNDDNESNNFFTNPICFNKENEGTIFNQSVLYLGGQQCPDLYLSRRADTKEYKDTTGVTHEEFKEHVTGIDYYDNNESQQKLVNISDTQTYMSLPDWTKKDINVRIKLSDFFKTYFNKDQPTFEKNFTIFITSCRHIDNTKENKNMFVLAEKITTAINFKISFDDFKKTDTNKINDSKQHEYDKEIREAYKKCLYSSFHFSFKKQFSNIDHVQRNNNTAKNGVICSGSKSKQIECTDENATLNINDIETKYLVDIIKTEDIITLKNGERIIYLKTLKEHIKNKYNKNNFFMLLYLLLLNVCNTNIHKQKPSRVGYYMDTYCIDYLIKIINIIFNNNKDNKDNINTIFDFIIFYLLKSNDIHKYDFKFIEMVIYKFVASSNPYHILSIEVLNLSDLIITSYSLLKKIIEYLTTKKEITIYYEDIKNKNYRKGTYITIKELKLDNIDFSDNMSNLKVIIDACAPNTTLKKITLHNSCYLKYSIIYDESVLELYYSEEPQDSNIWIRNQVEFVSLLGDNLPIEQSSITITDKHRLYINISDVPPMKYANSIENKYHTCNGKTKQNNYILLDKVRKNIGTTIDSFKFMLYLSKNISKNNNNIVLLIKVAGFIFQEKQLLFKYIIYHALTLKNSTLVKNLINTYMDIYPITKLDNDILDLSSFDQTVFYGHMLQYIIECLIGHKLDIIGINLNFTNFNRPYLLSEILQNINNIKIISSKQKNPNNKEIQTIFTDNNFTETKLHSCIWIRNSVENKEELLKLALALTPEFNQMPADNNMFDMFNFEMPADNMYAGISKLKL